MGLFSRGNVEMDSALARLVLKATDANLTSENWEYIMAVCDLVNENPAQNCSSVMDLVHKRLVVNDANVQIYTLQLIQSLSHNCGSRVQTIIASDTFIGEFLSMIKNPKVHTRVKDTIFSLMRTLVDSYKNDPSLRSIEKAYKSVENYVPSSIQPSKSELRAQEEAELEMALKLSQLDVSGPREDSGGIAPTSSQHSGLSRQTPEPLDPEPVSRVRAIYDFAAAEPGELTFKRGDVIQVVEAVYKDWWKGCLRGQLGIFPRNYVSVIRPPTRDELVKQAEDERVVFDQAKNIERLLALLTSGTALHAAGKPVNIAQDVELQQLYHSVLGVREKIVDLIRVYSERRQDLIELNQTFLEARETYNNLLDESVSRLTGHPDRTPSGYTDPYRARPTPPSDPYLVPSDPYSAPIPYPQAPRPTGPYRAVESSAPPSAPYAPT